MNFSKLIDYQNSVSPWGIVNSLKMADYGFPGRIAKQICDKIAPFNGQLSPNALRVQVIDLINAVTDTPEKYVRLINETGLTVQISSIIADSVMSFASIYNKDVAREWVAKNTMYQMPFTQQGSAFSSIEEIDDNKIEESVVSEPPKSAESPKSAEPPKSADPEPPKPANPEPPKSADPEPPKPANPEPPKSADPEPPKPANPEPPKPANPEPPKPAKPVVARPVLEIAVTSLTTEKTTEKATEKPDQKTIEEIANEVLCKRTTLLNQLTRAEVVKYGVSSIEEIQAYLEGKKAVQTMKELTTPKPFSPYKQTHASPAKSKKRDTLTWSVKAKVRPISEAITTTSQGYRKTITSALFLFDQTNRFEENKDWFLWATESDGAPIGWEVDEDGYYFIKRKAYLRHSLNTKTKEWTHFIRDDHNEWIDASNERIVYEYASDAIREKFSLVCPSQ